MPPAIPLLSSFSKVFFLFFSFFFVSQVRMCSESRTDEAAAAISLTHNEWLSPWWFHPPLRAASVWRTKQASFKRGHRNVRWEKMRILIWTLRSCWRRKCRKACAEHTQQEAAEKAFKTQKQECLRPKGSQLVLDYRIITVVLLCYYSINPSSNHIFRSNNCLLNLRRNLGLDEA